MTITQQLTCATVLWLKLNSSSAKVIPVAVYNTHSRHNPKKTERERYARAAFVTWHARHCTWQTVNDTWMNESSSALSTVSHCLGGSDYFYSVAWQVVLVQTTCRVVLSMLIHRRRNRWDFSFVLLCGDILRKTRFVKGSITQKGFTVVNNRELRKWISFFSLCNTRNIIYNNGRRYVRLFASYCWNT